MSRIIIKNLPGDITAAQLRDHFSKKEGPGGVITDAKVVLKKDGSSRRFGFVGYKNNDEAKKAKEWYDSTFVGRNRVVVEIVEAGFKVAPTPRPNKRARMEREIPSTSAVEKLAPEPSTSTNPLLDEFLQVMKPRNVKSRTWADGVNPNAKQELPTTSDANEDWTMYEEFHGIEDEQPETAPAEDLDDMEWLKRRTKASLHIESEKEFFQDVEDDEPVAPTLGGEEENVPIPEPPDATKDTIRQSARLFLRNLAFSCSEDELRQLLAPFGEIEEVHISLDPVTKNSRGLAFAKFADPEHAIAAYDALDKTSFQGRLLHILPAANRPGQSVEEGGKETLRSAKEKKRKEGAGKEFNWAMLYMNSDAVASSIADRMNISKSDILNPQASDGASPAVKLALAETHIIQETKNYLESEGINLETFSSMSHVTRQRRSETCILVKNIRYGTSLEQIREMFETHGALSRVLVPPAGTIAVVEFDHAVDAAKAFKALSYRRLGSSILYLEKAPTGIFVNPPDVDREQSKAGPHVSYAPKPVAISSTEPKGDEEDEVAVAPSGSTLFVKNLSFNTTAEQFKKAFQNLSSFAFARIQTKPDTRPNASSARLSMGYGFVGFKDNESAKKAMKAMQNFVLDGHVLQLNFAGRGVDGVEEKGEDKNNSRTTKMIVKNVPFEASKKDIRDLFGAHGQLKSVRLPKKFNSKTRGFAFLDFISHHEAENAYSTLRHTHLLGRHLVLEWARDEEDIEELRQKAGVGFGGGAELPGKKRKLALNEDNDGDE